MRTCSKEDTDGSHDGPDHVPSSDRHTCDASTRGEWGERESGMWNDHVPAREKHTCGEA